MCQAGKLLLFGAGQGQWCFQSFDAEISCLFFWRQHYDTWDKSAETVELLDARPDQLKRSIEPRGSTEHPQSNRFNTTTDTSHV